MAKYLVQEIKICFWFFQNKCLGAVDFLLQVNVYETFSCIRNYETTFKPRMRYEYISSNLPRYSQRNEYPYAHAVLYEIFRLASSVPLVNRCNSAEVEYSGYKIPPNTWTIGNVYSANRDPSVWDEPFEFRPERFLDEEGKFCEMTKLCSFGFG